MAQADPALERATKHVKQVRDVILFWGFGVLGHAISVFLGDRKVYEQERSRER
jgi:hypothetical protein